MHAKNKSAAFPYVNSPKLRTQSKYFHQDLTSTSPPPRAALAQFWMINCSTQNLLDGDKRHFSSVCQLYFSPKCKIRLCQDRVCKHRTLPLKNFTHGVRYTNLPLRGSGREQKTPEERKRAAASTDKTLDRTFHERAVLVRLRLSMFYALSRRLCITVDPCRRTLVISHPLL